MSAAKRGNWLFLRIVGFVKIEARTMRSFSLQAAVIEVGTVGLNRVCPTTGPFRAWKGRRGVGFELTNQKDTTGVQVFFCRAGRVCSIAAVAAVVAARRVFVDDLLMGQDKENPLNSRPEMETNSLSIFPKLTATRYGCWVTNTNSDTTSLGRATNLETQLIGRVTQVRGATTRERWP